MDIFMILSIITSVIIIVELLCCAGFLIVSAIKNDYAKSKTKGCVFIDRLGQRIFLPIDSIYTVEDDCGKATIYVDNLGKVELSNIFEDVVGVLLENGWKMELSDLSVHHEFERTYFKF